MLEWTWCSTIGLTATRIVVAKAARITGSE
jgi:hypothetical protein